MDALGGDPKAAFEKISKELQDVFDESGMGAVDKFVDKLDSIKEKCSSGPTAILDQLKKMFDEFKAGLQKALDDPSSLAPGGGVLASCASWYGNAVKNKLTDLNGDSAALLETIKKCAEDAAVPFQKLSEVLGQAMKELEGTLKKLSKLPNEVMKLKEVDKDEIAKIDTAPMKKCLDISGIDKPLGDLAGLKSVFDGILDLIKNGITKLADFTSSAPDKVRAAFEVPFPLCCMTASLMNQAPAPMKAMLDQVENLKKIELEGLVTMLEDVQGSVCTIDINKVKDPASKFAKAAGSKVDDLDKVVAGAKMASDPGGAVKDMASKVPGVGNLF